MTLTLTAEGVYQTLHMSRLLFIVLAALLAGPASIWADELPITKNLPIPEFQNRPEDAKPYDFDAPPQGMFRSITMAEGFEEELGFRQTHEIVPVKPTERFTADAPAIFIVFALHQHYQAFKVFGRCFPEGIAGIEPDTIISEDAMHMALEDESGYLKLLPPKERWIPGRYKVEIHAGEQVSEMSLIGTMRFTVVAGK
ncbi:MAG: hypothetical protein Q8N04_16690 [Nitrospira sp.]|nr:hypothetical protein [Nitrospira sp.]